MQALKSNPGLWIPYLAIVIVYLSFFLFSTHRVVVLAAIAGILFTLIMFSCHLSCPKLVILAFLALLVWFSVGPRLLGI